MIRSSPSVRAAASAATMARPAPQRKLPTSQPRASLLQRARAWWLGAENAEILARYGSSQGSFSSVASEWKMALLILGSMWASLVNYQTSTHAANTMAVLEINRKRHYERDFEPEFVKGAPARVYDGVQCYSYSDHETGIQVNSDNKVTGPNRPEMQRVFQENPPSVTATMVDQAKQLHKYRMAESQRGPA